MYSKFILPGTLSKFIIQLQRICNSGYRFSEIQDSIVTSIFGQSDDDILQVTYRYIHKAPPDKSYTF